MTDITELAQSLKAAAENAIGAHERLAEYQYGEIIDISQHEGEQIDIDITDLNEFNKEANPINVLALVEALEKAQQLIDELQQGFIANQEEAHEAIKYATELKEQLARANAGREEAFSEVDEMQKSLDHTHRRRTIWRWRAFTAEAEIAALRQRIADLDSRTVKLPKPHAHLIWIQAGHAPDDYWDDVAVSRSEKDRCCDGSERYPVYARWEIEEMLTAAGIKVEVE
ncbi:ead/Ea22-like family protein [Klebsiella pneumoniae]|uniref:ead/Ea22-like family protein n=1 Tax=Klebsiella pneumoniae TaxID=573 RepID=UPI0032DA9EF8